jgi:PTS system nitrogen regulatory IIA component
MSHEDFDLEGLAAYLHLTPQQVERLAVRGKVPGRKVAGQWRFSQAEVHHWMEEQMGLLEDDELVRVENVLARTAADDTAIVIAEMLLPEAVGVPLEARTRNSAILAMAQLAAGSGLLWDPEKMAAAVRAREDLQSTALDNGVALLHPRRPLASILSQPVLALGIAPSGIPFGGSKRLTDVFFLVCSTDDRTHLRTLARLSRLIGNEDFLQALRSAQDAGAVRRAVADFENQLE